MLRLDTSSFNELVSGDQAEPSALTLAMAAHEVLSEGQFPAAKTAKRIDFLLHEFLASLPSMTDPVEYVSALNEFLFDDKKFECCQDDTTDTSALFIAKVVENRRGTSLPLSLIYRQILQKCQVAPANLINFPGSFYLKMLYRHQLYFLDPSDRGKLLTVSDLQKKVSNRFGKNIFLNGAFLETPTEMQTVTRFLSKLKVHYLESRRWTLLLATLDMLVAANPTRTNEYKERGLLLYQLGCVQLAYEDLLFYVRRSRPSPELEKIRTLIKQIENPNITPLF